MRPLLDMGTSLKHEMFKEMCKTRLSLHLISSPHLIVEGYPHQRECLFLTHDEFQPVLQSMLAH